MSPLRKSRIRTLADLESAAVGVGVGVGVGGVADTSTSTSRDPKYHRPIPSNPYTAHTSSASGKQQRTAPSDNPSSSFSFQVAHIATLPNAAEALALLQRVCHEFQPILQRRGYNVLSVSEMCCCGDGLCPRKQQGRKNKKIMASNVLGYNQTTFFSGATTSRRGNKNKNKNNKMKSHTIHLRLRHPQDHARLYLYEDVAGTMAHELSHCEIGPHNDAFNKLMDDILEEHMVLQCQQQQQQPSGNTFRGTAPPPPLPTPFSGKGNVLGGSDVNKAFPLKNPGYKLGGDNAFSKLLSPREAAVMAAEARRRQLKLRARGRHCCQPCIITIPDNDDEEPIIEYANNNNDDHDHDHDEDSRKMAVKKQSENKKRPAVKVVVSQTKAGGDCKKKSKPPVHRVPQSTAAFVDLTADDATPKAASLGTTAHPEWPCGACTFINPPMALMCSICTTEKKRAAK
jgi:DNA-dependent metalloprotease WSS1